ncbi:hypothetical protein RRG08_038496 [Elysia crispata]|uniref:Uncharacterized protein n=1 Tax=Elysia crispata TaxID=231223 RepID=A0AAE1AIC8_9GAST|nr:hypothetical protein RRG08_038496 [Elysia crispata]
MPLPILVLRKTAEGALVPATSAKYENSVDSISEGWHWRESMSDRELVVIISSDVWSLEVEANSEGWLYTKYDNIAVYVEDWNQIIHLQLWSLRLSDFVGQGIGD